MATHFSLLLLLLFTITCILLIPEFGASEEEANRKVYIVYMGHNPHDHTYTSSLHLSMLREAVGSDASNYLRHSYTKSFHGYSAKITDKEAKKISGMAGVVSVFPSQNSKVHTTRSWDFLNFPLGVRRSTSESDVIIGVIDTGIWPESESFSDVGYGQPPKKWKGICQASANFSCNNKIIGARFYRKNASLDPKDLISPRDTNGHGTHTASTAAGNIVDKASVSGIRAGTARGGVPRARIAAYKACWHDGNCADEDILAAFDDAIADGVDLISVSAGPEFATNYFNDAYVIGSYHAMRKGILTVQSGGNSGPNPQTICSISPWILSVAASTTDRKIVTPVKLGNNMVFYGGSVNTFKLDHLYPLIYAGDAPNTKAGFNGSISSLCSENSLDKNLVRGKIVLCGTQSSGEPELSAGAVGSVMADPGPYYDVLQYYPLPASSVDFGKAENISKYIKATRNPTATIMKSIDINDPLAPYVATFSSRGPNPINPHILKPDLTAPGVTIIAAYSPLGEVSPGDKRSFAFSIISGTSMSCPHVSGLAAYIKTFQPTWSPAAIKSALMTTASPISTELNPDAEFAYGAGHINPTKALNPGLVYDTSEEDYLGFLCGEGFTTKQIKLMTNNRNSGCSKFRKGSKNNKKDLNYPAFVIPTLRNEIVTMTFNRTVTNVGSASSRYVAKYPSANNFLMVVEPSVLEFKYVGEKLSYGMVVKVRFGDTDYPILSASLTWDDGVHQVRSPIVVHVPT